MDNSSKSLDRMYKERETLNANILSIENEMIATSGNYFFKTVNIEDSDNFHVSVYDYITHNGNLFSFFSCHSVRNEKVQGFSDWEIDNSPKRELLIELYSKPILNKSINASIINNLRQGKEVLISKCDHRKTDIDKYYLDSCNKAYDYIKDNLKMPSWFFSTLRYKLELNTNYIKSVLLDKYKPWEHPDFSERHVSTASGIKNLMIYAKLRDFIESHKVEYLKSQFEESLKKKEVVEDKEIKKI